MLNISSKLPCLLAIVCVAASGVSSGREVGVEIDYVIVINGSQPLTLSGFQVHNTTTTNIDYQDEIVQPEKSFTVTAFLYYKHDPFLDSNIIHFSYKDDNVHALVYSSQRNRGGSPVHRKTNINRQIHLIIKKFWEGLSHFLQSASQNTLNFSCNETISTVCSMTSVSSIGSVADEIEGE